MFEVQGRIELPLFAHPRDIFPPVLESQSFACTSVLSSFQWCDHLKKDPNTTMENEMAKNTTAKKAVWSQPSDISIHVTSFFFFTDVTSPTHRDGDLNLDVFPGQWIPVPCPCHSMGLPVRTAEKRP